MINQEGTYCPGPNAQTSGNMWAFSKSKYLDGREPPHLFVKSAYCSSLILTLRPYRGTLNKFPKILPYFFHLQFQSHFVCSQVSSRIKGTYSRNLTRLFFYRFHCFWEEHVEPDELPWRNFCGCWSTLVLTWFKWKQPTIPSSTLLDSSKKDIWQQLLAQSSVWWP